LVYGIHESITRRACELIGEQSLSIGCMTDHRASTSSA
jgi:hypothetical protein